MFTNNISSFHCNGPVARLLQLTLEGSHVRPIRFSLQLERSVADGKTLPNHITNGTWLQTGTVAIMVNVHE